MSKRKLISTTSDFPNVRVYEHEQPHGKKYTIAFRNLEELTGWEQMLFWITAIAFIALTGGIGFIVLILAAIIWNFTRRTVHREIALDYGHDLFRVYRGGKLELERQLSQLKHVTVDRHPDTELERENRRRQKREGPGDKEKTHCLFGWFGRGGAEQIILVSRLEWPSRNSLRQVREAIEWIRTEVSVDAVKDYSANDGWD